MSKYTSKKKKLDEDEEEQDVEQAVVEDERVEDTEEVSADSGEKPEEVDDQDDEQDTPEEDDTEDTPEESDDEEPEDAPDEDEQDTFDRAYVEKLRKENAKYRDRAKRTDELAHRLQTALVAADGRLADPEDLEYSDEYLDDPGALQDAITELIKRKPGLRSRKFHGDAGAGDRGSKHKAPVDLLQIMKSM